MKKIVAAFVVSGFALGGCNVDVNRTPPAPTLTQCSYIDDEVNDYDDLDPSDPNACYAPDDDKKKKKAGLVKNLKKVEKAVKKSKKKRKKNG